MRMIGGERWITAAIVLLFVGWHVLAFRVALRRGRRRQSRSSEHLLSSNESIEPR